MVEEPVVLLYDLFPPDRVLCPRRDERRDDLFQLGRFQGNLGDAILDDAKVHLQRCVGAVGLEAPVARTDKDELHPGYAIFGHLGKALEDAHAHPALAQGIAELVGQDDQPFVALLELGIRKQVLEDGEQAIGAERQLLTGGLAVGFLEQLHGRGFVLPQILLEGLQFLPRIIPAQEGQEIVKDAAGFPGLLALLPRL